LTPSRLPWPRAMLAILTERRTSVRSIPRSRTAAFMPACGRPFDAAAAGEYGRKLCRYFFLPVRRNSLGSLLHLSLDAATWGRSVASPHP
jgi:hypothetical protein